MALRHKGVLIMGFISKLFGIGVVAGAATAAVKIAQKYEENKENAASVGEVPDTQDASTVLNDIGKAATEVYGETAAKVKKVVTDVAAKAGVDTGSLTDSITDAGKAIGDAGKAVFDTVSANAPEFVDKAKEKAADVVEQVKSDIESVVGEAKDAIESVTDETEEAPQETPETSAPDPEAHESVKVTPEKIQ
jgi:ElaB/YqjD/DUF883 family membrane-anchored ribosome-binding protein